MAEKEITSLSSISFGKICEKLIDNYSEKF